MLTGGDNRFRDLIASNIGWWADAGVDTAISETPRDWLARPAAASAPQTPARTANAGPVANVAPAAATPLPDDLAALQILLATGAYAPNPAPPRRRVAPAGDPASGLMVVADMPEQDDAAAGHLFAGETKRLFEAMLAAMGRTRETIYFAPFSPARLAGRADPEHAGALTALMRRHIALARPRGVILFGDAPCRALLGQERGPEQGRPRGGLRSLNHDGGTVAAIALVHPRMLLKHPVFKADAWADMRLMIGELSK